MAVKKTINKVRAKGKSLFGTATFWGIILTLLIATKAPVEDALQKKTIEPNDLWQILQAMASALIIIVDRYNNDSTIYTPKGILGRNKETVESQLNQDEESVN